MRICIVILTILFFNSVRGQDSISLGPQFETDSRNIPLTILQSENYFYVMRYNKLAHDFTIEKRNRHDSHTCKFIPLKLKDVCADWFDFEKLDYLFFEKNGKLNFVFEKITNTKKTIYCKTIDSSGFSKGFKELCALELENNTRDHWFEFKTTADTNLLIIACANYMSGWARKSVLFFNMQTIAPIWIKKLPDENYERTISARFTVNENNDLWYLKRTFFETIDSTTNEKSLKDTMLLCKIPSEEKTLYVFPLKTPANYGLNDAEILPLRNGALFFAYMHEPLTKKQGALSNGFVFAQLVSGDSTIYAKLTPYDESTQNKLSYYDASDFKDPGFKPFAIQDVIVKNNSAVCILERKTIGFYKDILTMKLDISSGTVKWMHVIPRKIFFFPNRVTFKSIGCYSASYLNDELNIYFLDHPANLKKDIHVTSYDDSKQYTEGGRYNAVKITISDSEITKKALKISEKNDFIPLKKRTIMADAPQIFYLFGGEKERFAFE